MKQRIQTTGKRVLPENTPRRTLRCSHFWGDMDLVKYIAAAAVLLLLLLNLLSHYVSVVRYYGNGMEPTLSDREVLLVVKTQEVGEGDVIAFYYNNKVLVRRVVCEGGRELSIDAAGNVS
ncbi:MAG: S24 family peptidase, partial [Oscillibacter sp.]|nr:S24 family peptidase [Oscillibacter sp.]